MTVTTSRSPTVRSVDRRTSVRSPAAVTHRRYGAAPLGLMSTKVGCSSATAVATAVAVAEVGARGAGGDQVGVDGAAVARGGVEEAQLRRALVRPLLGLVDRSQRRRAGVRVGHERHRLALVQGRREGGDGRAGDAAADAEVVAALVQVLVAAGGERRDAAAQPVGRFVEVERAELVGRVDQPHLAGIGRDVAAAAGDEKGRGGEGREKGTKGEAHGGFGEGGRGPGSKARPHCRRGGRRRSAAPGAYISRCSPALSPPRIT